MLLVPSRGRPQNVARLIEACAKTCRTDAVIHFGFDDDDPQLAANMGVLTGYVYSSVRSRMGLGPWTNELARLAMADDPKWLCSIGDDMVPVTDGWDERLCEAAGPAGMAYPDDKRRSDIPECCVIGTAVVRALGWMCEPSLDHWYVDTVWSDLGRGAGCLRYLPDTVVEHRHPNVPGGDPHDATYGDAAARYGLDMAAYQKWRMKRMRADIETVRRVHAG